MSHKTLIVFALAGALSSLAEAGIAEDSSSVHQGDWPIQNGVKHQPNRNELGGGHEFAPDQAREIDRLYDQLLSGGGDKAQPRRAR